MTYFNLKILRIYDVIKTLIKIYSHEYYKN